MSDISTKKTIEIWDDRDGFVLCVSPDDGYVKLVASDSDVSVPTTISFGTGIIGPLCIALHEVARNVIENTKEDDAD